MALSHGFTGRLGKNLPVMYTAMVLSNNRSKMDQDTQNEFLTAV